MAVVVVVMDDEGNEEKGEEERGRNNIKMLAPLQRACQLSNDY